MMGFFDKLKQSASKATDMAKDSVEIVRLNGQISAKRKEIEKQYLLIGQAVFEADLKDELDTIKGLIEGPRTIILDCQAEIKDLEEKIKTIKAVKDCECGSVLPLDARFCSSCGKKFDIPAPVEVVQEVPAGAILIEQPAVDADQQKNCASCNAVIGAEDQFCLECGTKVQ